MTELLKKTIYQWGKIMQPRNRQFNANGHIFKSLRTGVFNGCKARDDQIIKYT